MRWTPAKFNTNNCNKWLIHLHSLNLIKINNDLGHFAPPFNIRITEEIYKKIKKIYPSNEETGGLMFASVTNVNNEIILNVESILEIPNDVEIEFPGNSKTNSYFPNRTQYIKALSKNFSKRNHFKILLPIHFHTHPTQNKLEDVRYYSQLNHPLNTSEADIEVAKSRHIQLNNFTLFYLNAIITGDEKEHRIMFYGKKVTPKNYIKEKSKQLIDTVEEVTDEISHEGWRIFTRIALAGFAMIGAIKAPQLVQPLMDNFVYALDKKEFWGKLENGTTVIKIPFRNTDNDESWDIQ